MEIVLASGNAHKKMELEKIFSSHILLLPSELGIQFDCEETGQTFLENALLKAETLYKLVKRPVLSDDSGLCVNALNGAPGIYSARYGSVEGGPQLNDAERNNLLLSQLERAADREASFVCCMVLMADPYRVFTVQESFPGSISKEPFGGGGFGYDPVFVEPESGKTVAALPEDVKNRISHRGRAGRRMNAVLEDLNE
jgi:XTP/dITP diphosphohydrolase